MRTLEAALIGHPVAHSLSPVLHRAAGLACGIAVDYQLVDVAVGHVETAVARLRAGGLHGINITAPHKAEVLACADVLTPVARRVGVINTLHFIDGPGGATIGDNTDVVGFSRALGPLPGPRAVVLGAGGAARAVLVALLDAGIERVHVLNRRLERAEALCADLIDPRLHPGHLSTAPDRMRGADLLVSSLPSSVGAVVTDLPFHVLAPHAPIVTLDYGKRALSLAAAVGPERVFVDGLAMLAWQGIDAFQRWTGLRPPIGPVIDALKVAAAPSD